MNQVPTIHKPRRQGAYLSATWISDDALNERLGEVTPFADLYILRLTTPGVTFTWVFDSLDQVIERLQASSCCGGDHVEIYAVGEPQLELRAKVPDLEGLAPIDFFGDTHE